MSIRSIDFQVMIPKAPEIQKTKHIENENQRINQHINVINDSTEKSNELKRVNKCDKAYKFRIEKDDKKGKPKSGGEECDKNDKRNKKNKNITGSKIDVRI